MGADMHLATGAVRDDMDRAEPFSLRNRLRHRLDAGS